MGSASPIGSPANDATSAANSVDSILESAIDYAARGWPVVVLHGIDTRGKCVCGKTNCTAPGKRPWTNAWQQRASTQPAKITQRLAEHAGSNIGLLLGPRSGIIDLEVDSPEAEAELEVWFGGLIPATPTFKSSRGLHRIFRWDDRLADMQAVVHVGAIECRLGGSKGAQSVAPPSNHQSGVTYSWTISPNECEPAQLPDEVIDRILAARSPDAAKSVVENTITRTTQKSTVDAGDAHSQVLDAGRRYAAKWRGRKGQRNNGLFSLAGHLWAFVSSDGAERLTDDEVLELVRNANLNNTPQLDDAELQSLVKSSAKNGTPRKPHVVEIREKRAMATDTTGTATTPIIGPYRETDAGLVFMKATRDGAIPVALTNFTAKIVSYIIYDDGAETKRAFEIEAQQHGRAWRFALPSSQFSAMNWPAEHLGTQAIVWPGFSTKDHARAAIQLLSGTVPEHRIYRHTGWREIGGQPVYLHAGGALGPHGPVTGIEADLPSALCNYQLPDPPSGETLKEAVGATLRLTELLDDDAMLPLWAAVWRAVVGPSDFAVHLAGETGFGKSELAALAQQHFGPLLDSRRLPANWSSTANALEGIAFAAKDALLFVDDFAPSGSTIDQQRTHREAARLIRAQGNRQGRERMTASADLRPSKAPRGLICSTGEDVPRDQSIRARLLILAIERPLAAWWDRLSACQADAAAGKYAQAMSAFLVWLAPRFDGEQERMRKRVIELRAEATAGTEHKRTPSIVAELAYGVERFTEFAIEAGAMTAAEGAALRDRAWAALGRAAAAQAAHQQQSDPVRRFLELIGTALVSGRGHLADRDGNEPQNSIRWGWRERTFGSGDHVRTEWVPMGERIGWVVDSRIYLDPDAAFRAVTSIDGAAIGVTAGTLWKRLRDRGLLAAADGDGKHLTIRVVLQGARRRVLHLIGGLSEPEVGHVGHAVPRADFTEANGPPAGPLPGRDGERVGHEMGHKLLDNHACGPEGPLGPPLGGAEIKDLEPGCALSHTDPAEWHEVPTADGRIRTTCRGCGALIGYLPAGGAYRG